MTPPPSLKIFLRILKNQGITRKIILDIKIILCYYIIIKREEDKKMAWYEMEYRCGHSERVQLYGPRRDRERTLEWAKEHKDCPECYKERMEKERDERNARSAQLATEIGFTPLNGTPKQIAWANAIRQQHYEELCSYAKPHPEHGYKLLAQAFSLETSAQWWIENRNADAEGIARRIVAAHPAQWQELQNTGKEVAK